MVHLLLLFCLFLVTGILLSWLLFSGFPGVTEIVLQSHDYVMYILSTTLPFLKTEQGSNDEKCSLNGILQKISNITLKIIESYGMK
jgi:hypothetical protein